MLQKFQQYIQSNKLFTKQNFLILGISGGEDSVVLAHLLHQSGYQFMLAHANFNLRGKDSKADEEFCTKLANKLKVKFVSHTFDVKSYCQKNKVSIQIAARDLRYAWFDQLLTHNSADYLLTAHHATDSIETVFINLLRGTGIKGLKGIPEKAGKIIRPLLSFKKEDISTYAKNNGIKFRLDKSNLDDKYQRNFIRLNIIPKFKKLNPQFETTLLHNMLHFQDESSIVDDYLESESKKLLSKKNNLLHIQKTELVKHKHASSILNYLLKDFGFNETQQLNILKNVKNNGLSGKLFYSDTHCLTIDRDTLILKENKTNTTTDCIIENLKDLKQSKNLKVSYPKSLLKAKKNELYIEVSRLIFPIVVRSRKTGDKFKPFGMNGFKLVSDFMKDEKMNNFEKENCRVLVNGNNEIIWLINHRSDERYRIGKSGTEFIKINYRD